MLHKQQHIREHKIASSLTKPSLTKPFVTWTATHTHSETPTSSRLQPIILPERSPGPHTTGVEQKNPFH